MAETGWKYGKRKVRVVQVISEHPWGGRTYRVLTVTTGEGQDYVALRLYNGRGHFIKQFLMEPQVAPLVGRILAQL